LKTIYRSIVVPNALGPDEKPTIRRATFGKGGVCPDLNETRRSLLKVILNFNSPKEIKLRLENCGLSVCD